MQKILHGIETVDQEDKKLMLVKVRFSIKAYKNLSDRDIEKLNDTTREFFLFYKKLW